ncbi:MAG: nucleotidyltransferase family protein, partial [Clostridiales bacterium]|nr:nucleotidyltransferase family protein [Clostridiales bacterium]
MNAAFVIAEYNPFHNGHAYHIARTRRELAPDALVCVMSGHFTQRGSPAVVDKWARARMALLSGADLVLELHPVYACAGAERFALGAIATIGAFATPDGNNMDCWLSFGAECGDLSLLLELGAILAEEPPPFREALAASLGAGSSFAAARAEAAAACCTTQAATAGDSARRRVKETLKGSNNILALEYIKAIRRLRLPIKPHLIP